MKIKGCSIKNFTVFDKQEIKFCDGINVIIGANGTGKTHLMKLLYSLIKGSKESDPKDPPPMFTIQDNLEGVFKPEDGNITHLLRRSQRRTEADISIKIDKWGLNFGIDMSGVISANQDSTFPLMDDVSTIYIPPNDVLAIYPGFAASYKKRELSFDQTYYDICRALEPTPLKQKELNLDKVNDALEKLLLGKVIQKGDRFYVRGKNHETMLEAHLLAEGHRKIAALVHLINNGSINSNTILFWDEPEANLNPVLTRSIVQCLIGLVEVGVQVFLATHDYLLTGELSLVSEYNLSPAIPLLFHAMSRKEDGPVRVQPGKTLADLKNNPILDEFAAHYEREQKAAFKFMQEQNNNASRKRKKA